MPSILEEVQPSWVEDGWGIQGEQDEYRFDDDLPWDITAWTRDQQTQDQQDFNCCKKTGCCCFQVFISFTSADPGSDGCHYDTVIDCSSGVPFGSFNTCCSGSVNAFAVGKFIQPDPCCDGNCDELVCLCESCDDPSPSCCPCTEFCVDGHCPTGGRDCVDGQCCASTFCCPTADTIFATISFNEDCSINSGFIESTGVGYIVSFSGTSGELDFSDFPPEVGTLSGHFTTDQGCGYGACTNTDPCGGSFCSGPVSEEVCTTDLYSGGLPGTYEGDGTVCP